MLLNKVVNSVITTHDKLCRWIEVYPGYSWLVDFGTCVCRLILGVVNERVKVRVSNAIRRYAKVRYAKGKGNPNSNPILTLTQTRLLP